MTNADGPGPKGVTGRLNERMKGKATPPGFIRFHRWLYRTSGGRLGHGLVGAPSLVLTTTGRKTGGPRANVLVYASDSGSYVVVASNHGGEHDPGWLFNIRANPAVEVQVARRKSPAKARVVERSDPEHPRLWALVNAGNHDRYEGYQARTARPIPVVIIEPGTR